jgi:hypothetical protein
VTQHGVLADRGEQVRAHVDDLFGPGEGTHQVEAEAVDVHLGDPVAQRVQDHPQALGVGGVDGVAAAGDVPVAHGLGLAARLGGRRHDALVVAAVVEAAEAQGRPAGARLGRVVVDHVEDDLEPGEVEVLDHLLELGDLLAAVTGRRVRVVRGEEAQRVVAPVVDQAALGEIGLGEELVHGQQLDRRHAEVLEVVGHRGRRQAGVRPAELLGHPVVQGGHALDVHLVDHGVAPPAVRRGVRAPLEVVVHHDAARDVRSRVEVAARRGVVHHVAEDGLVDDEVARDGLPVGVEEQLGRVEPQAGLGVPRSVGAVAVERAPGDARDGAVPHAQRVLGEPVPRLHAVVVEQADPHRASLGGVHREVGRVPGPRRAQGMVATRPDRHGLAVVLPGSGPPGGRCHAGHCRRTSGARHNAARTAAIRGHPQPRPRRRPRDKEPPWSSSRST